MNNQATVIAIIIATVGVALVASRVVADESPILTNSIGMKLARIPAGKFLMGSPRSEADRSNKEQRHEITIAKPFHMGIYEVTQAQYSEVVQDQEGFQNRSAFKGASNPVENVEWKKAQRFCELLTARTEEKSAMRKYRLPSEAEWEYACRAGTTTAFHVGDRLASTQANFNGNYSSQGSGKGPYLRRTTKVGSYKPNAFGLYDMHGNVAEWCADWYDPAYYLDSPDEDPLGPPFGVVPTKFTNNGKQNFFVVVRGGCWVDDARACRSAYRFRAMPNTQYRLIGFRVVCDLQSKSEENDR